MPLIGFFLNNRIGQIIGLVIVGSSLFFGWLAVHDNNIWNKAVEAFNTKQEALVQQKQEEFKQKTEQISDTADRIRQAIAESQKKNSETVTNIAKNTEGRGDQQASPYLKSIVKQLQAAYGEKK